MKQKYNIDNRSKKIAGTLFFACALSAIPAGAETLRIELPEASTKDGTLVISNADGKIAEFKASAYAQFQYVYSSADGGNKSRNGFSLRRTDIALSAKIDDHWSAAVAFEFDSKSDGGIANNGYIEYAYIGYATEAGKLSVGQLKPHFLQEEITSCLNLPAIERSIVTNYLSSPNADIRGLSAAHIGVFWDGKLRANDLPPINYGFSVTNAVGQDYDARSNELSLTSYIETEFHLRKQTILTLGLSGVANFGNDGELPEIKGGPIANAGTVYGIEPYLKLSAGGLNILLDGYYVNGNDSSHVSRTLGAIALASYRLENDFEPVFRIARLNTQTKNAGVHSGYQANVPATGKHSNAVTYYAGANYYVNKHVKISAGYEYGYYFGTGRSEESSAFRTQVQIAF